MSTRIASGSVSVPLALAVDAVADAVPLVDAESAVLNDQLVCQFAPS